ncbi:hypothetical protein [Dokdonella sp.]|uniref:hypothetical protein n=1 Tax=Dokdonella sp. TaxID=2291710 RepID=UPI002F415DF6
MNRSVARAPAHESRAEGARGPRRAGTWRSLAVLVGAVLLAYANAFAAAYQFDDFAAILANPSTQGLSDWWRSLPGIRPLLKLSFALTFEAGGGAVAIHAGNVAIHAANACLLWSLWRRWLPRLAPALGPVDATALLAALLFALHPAATEAVTYASGRSISLAATFVLGAVLADDAACMQPSRRALAWLGPALFALALAVRETAVVMPAIPLLRAWAEGISLRAATRRLRPYALVLAIAAVAALATPGYHVFFGVSLATRPLAAQLASQLLAHGYLLTHPLVGITNIDPDLRVPTAWSASLAVVVALLVGLAVAMSAARRRMAWLAFGIGWYFLQLAPANSLLPRLDLANDRHLYLALAGPMLVVACALMRTAERVRARTAARVVAYASCAMLAFATAMRNADYRSEVALWQATVRESPGKARAWLNLGYAWRLDGDATRAAAAYRCALALDPTNAQAAIDLDMVAPDDGIAAGCPASG